GSVPSLSVFFLNPFVRNEETRLPMTHPRSKSVRFGKLPLDLDCDIRSGAGVREVLLDGRIEIAGSVCGAAAHPQQHARPSVLNGSAAAGRGEASDRCDGAAVNALAGVCCGHHFDDAAELATVFRRISTRQDAPR